VLCQQNGKDEFSRHENLIYAMTRQPYCFFRSSARAPAKMFGSA
jgi:hypothetical protein